MQRRTRLLVEVSVVIEMTGNARWSVSDKFDNGLKLDVLEANVIWWF